MSRPKKQTEENIKQEDNQWVNKVFDRLPEDQIHYIINPSTGLEDPTLGIAYDFKKIRKAYDALDCPPEVYDPTVLPFESGCKYFVLVSSRSTGKTTNIVLLGMVFNAKYGTQTIYMRQTPDMITKKNLNKLLSVIKACKYVEKITQGRYNDVLYFAGEWRYINVDEKGNTIDKSEPFMLSCDIDEREIYKSSLNVPRGDIIIYDEMISNRYRPDEFVDFQDLLKTIIRERFSPLIFCLSNCTHIYSKYLVEMDIQKDFSKIGEDEHFIKVTGKGTRIYGERIGVKFKNRAELNSKFFGFENAKLAAITGGEWIIGAFQRLKRNIEFERVETRLFLKYAGLVVQLELCYSDQIGLFVYPHEANRAYDDALIVYTLEEITAKNEQYKFGMDKLSATIWKLYKANKFYYGTNEVGYAIENYIKEAIKL